MKQWTDGIIFCRVQRMGFGAIPPSFLPPLLLCQKTRRDKESPTCNSGGAPPLASTDTFQAIIHQIYAYNHNLLFQPQKPLHFNFQRCIFSNIHNNQPMQLHCMAWTIIRRRNATPLHHRILSPEHRVHGHTRTRRLVGSGRVWGRTLCSTNSATGKFACATGDC